MLPLRCYFPLIWQGIAQVPLLVRFRPLAFISNTADFRRFRPCIVDGWTVGGQKPDPVLSLNSTNLPFYYIFIPPDSRGFD